MEFYKTIENAWVKKDSMVCVGLDPDLQKMPVHLKAVENPIFEFNRALVDATADLVCAYKPQFAYYAAQNAESQLGMTIDYIHRHHPGIPVILDAKRGDIGNTAKMYAREVFARYGADAVTVNPYMGGDTLEPFLERKDKGIIILCRTSNPGAGDIQDLESGGKKIYEIIAQKAATEWNDNQNVLLVVGATYPLELKKIREIAAEMPFLVPGIGAQGGNIEAVVINGKTESGGGMIINSSRGIIYAGAGPDFAEAARRETETLRKTINRYRQTNLPLIEK